MINYIFVHCLPSGRVTYLPRMNDCLNCYRFICSWVFFATKSGNNLSTNEPFCAVIEMIFLLTFTLAVLFLICSCWTTGYSFIWVKTNSLWSMWREVWIQSETMWPSVIEITCSISAKFKVEFTKTFSLAYSEVLLLQLGWPYFQRCYLLLVAPAPASVLPS